MAKKIKNLTAGVKILNLDSGKMLHIKAASSELIDDSDIGSQDVQIQLAQGHCMITDVPQEESVRVTTTTKKKDLKLPDPLPGRIDE